MATNYFWKVSMLRGAAICMLDCKQSELSTCRARWLHCYLVSLAVGIIYKYQNLSPWVSVVLLSFFISFVRILLSNILSVDKLREPYNFMEKWLRMRKHSIPGRFSPSTWPGYKANTNSSFVPRLPPSFLSAAVSILQVMGSWVAAWGGGYTGSYNISKLFSSYRIHVSVLKYREITNTI